MIIGLSGKKQSGKSTTAAFLKKSLEGAVEMNFADSLKRICVDVFGAEVSHVSGTEDEKNRLIAGLGLSGRQLMQRLGEFGRKIKPDCWISAWQNEVAATWAANGVVPIITADVRYLNEVLAIRQQGGIVLRLTRAPLADEHLSETALDDYDGWDAVIDNVGLSIEETNFRVAVECERLGVV